MALFVLFGVKASATADVDEVGRLIESVVGVAPRRRIGEDIGRYYIFESESGERLQLVPAIFADEEGPFLAEPEFSGWTYLLYLNNSAPQSDWLQKLRQAPDVFVELRSRKRD
jgi:hypothetical protein